MPVNQFSVSVIVFEITAFDEIRTCTCSSSPFFLISHFIELYLCYKISAVVVVYTVLSQHMFLACVGFVKVCQKWKRLFMVFGMSDISGSSLSLFQFF